MSNPYEVRPISLESMIEDLGSVKIWQGQFDWYAENARTGEYKIGDTPREAIENLHTASWKKREDVLSKCRTYGHEWATKHTEDGETAWVCERCGSVKHEPPAAWRERRNDG